MHSKLVGIAEKKESFYRACGNNVTREFANEATSLTNLACRTVESVVAQCVLEAYRFSL